ncbi:acetate CoA/acetoacetate CoA-transferase beta subunit [Bacillus mesophilus]|uniref:CoA transferase subunit B n=1 Tax=Bacillus mesophilus TaxID=1808955 RepID=A0A6M0QCE2_9BACI|nr:acetate CoA/acetoacetate CoA-transferase beta subunit [Bacillus mesophilus]NEY73966.1 CoA transferase subunit B [Bacillus mesophilus]
MGMGIDIRNMIAARAAQEVKHNMVVNLGIGIPSLVPNHLPKAINVMFHAENGVLGMGESPPKGKEDENLCNAGGYPVTIVPGASYFDSAMAFAIIRRGLIDLTILGALQVSEQGDLANWIVPGKRVPGMGGAIDLAQKAKKVIVVMNHTNKDGSPKIVRECTLPLTATRCVNMVITDYAVLEVKEDGLWLREVMTPYSIDDVINNTDVELLIDHSLKDID